MSEKKEKPKITVRDRRRVRMDEGQSPLSAVPEPEASGGPTGVVEGDGAAADEALRPSSPSDAEERPNGEEAGDGAQATDASSEAPSERADGDGSELERAKAQAGEYLEHLQRLKAEFDNYRKRVLKEQTRAVERAAEPLIGRLLEVLDDFDLALIAAEKKPDFDKFLHGVELVYAKLQDILRGEGLERIEAQGKPFDPELHEALMQSGSDDGEPYVADVFRQGYTLKGRVIRPAGVKVSRKA